MKLFSHIHLLPLYPLGPYSDFVFLNAQNIYHLSAEHLCASSNHSSFGNLTSKLDLHLPLQHVNLTAIYGHL